MIYSDLRATIAFYRPDIMHNIDGDLIALNPPTGYFQCTLYSAIHSLLTSSQAYYVPDVGEPMLASFTTSASRFGDSISAENHWYASKRLHYAYILKVDGGKV